MTESTTRSAVGVFLILAQIAVIVLAIGIYVRQGLKFDELTTAVALILPMFAVHTAAIAKYFTAHRSEVNQRSRPVTGAFALLAFVTPFLFVAYLSGVLIVKATGYAFGAPEEFKWALGLGEICFGVYLGAFIGSLFDEKPARH